MDQSPVIHIILSVIQPVDSEHNSFSTFRGHNGNVFVICVDERHYGVSWFRNKSMDLVAQNAFCLRNKAYYTFLPISFHWLLQPDAIFYSKCSGITSFKGTIHRAYRSNTKSEGNLKNGKCPGRLYYHISRQNQWCFTPSGHVKHEGLKPDVICAVYFILFMFHQAVNQSINQSINQWHRSTFHVWKERTHGAVYTSLK